MKHLCRIVSAVLVLCLCAGLFSGCSAGQKKKIVIYSSAEDYRNDTFREDLRAAFPEYEIDIVELDTGTLAARLAAEGADLEADIILELESTYLKQNADSLATLDMIDFSIYTDDLVPADHKYVPLDRMSGAIIVDTEALAERGLPIPQSYDDLLKPEYRGLISMPNPKSSGTGYIFLLNMVNERGEAAAFEYFDRLAENLSGQGFTTSGSGPVKALVTREAAIGLCITFQAAQSINEGNDFTILFFDEGAPYTSYSSAVLEGRQQDEDVMRVFDYICKVSSPKDKELYAPEPIFKDQDITMENFPTDISYGNMEGIDDPELKEHLLDQWNH